jgi:hypothetical protein
MKGAAFAASWFTNWFIEMSPFDSAGNALLRISCSAQDDKIGWAYDHPASDPELRTEH